MKRLLSFCLLALGLTNAQAQKGSVLVFGDVNLSTQRHASDSLTQSGAIRPGVGYQFNKNFTVGLTGGYGIVSEKAPNSDKRFNTTNWNAGVFLRYTQPVSPMFALFAQFEAGYTSSNQKYDNKVIPGHVDGQDRYNGYYAGITPAVAMFVGKGFALNFGIGGITYRSETQDLSGAKASSTFNLNFGKQLNIGISKNFGGSCCSGKCHKGKKMAEEGDAYQDESEAPRKKEKKVKGDDL